MSKKMSPASSESKKMGSASRESKRLSPAIGSLVRALSLAIAIASATACSSADAVAPVASDAAASDAAGDASSDAPAADAADDSALDASAEPDADGDASDGSSEASDATTHDVVEEVSCPVDHCSNHLGDCDESDNDCGGSLCATCADGRYCNVDGDCSSKRCASLGVRGKCAAATCTDNITNGTESDVDCGGQACSPCVDGRRCNDASDCATAYCSATHVCGVPTCFDRAANGDESDVDCGGSCALKCAATRACSLDSDCATARCASGRCACPPDMVLGPGIAPYCIDATEVTNEAYATYLAADVLPTFPLACSFDTDLVPTVGWPAAAGDATKPVTSVDWCDAWAYCSYLGRRLCGDGGAPVAAADFSNAALGEWWLACTGNGVNEYPYGNTFQSTGCNGGGYSDSSGGVADVPVGGVGTATCEGTMPALFDMSGNVAEWEDACDDAAGAGDHCRARGGSFASDATGLRCDAAGADAPSTRDATSPSIGFRCCL